ncbi:MAG: AbrB/MazE/SpoVT family DNA-binding domain-containing protein [Chloroflexi bacterium]|nr:AbrB/MazE/SpoVT family DNA-binding domain-containing protein [Chloroflexota bacterium]
MSDTFARVKINSQGRVIIPAALRNAAGLKPGETAIMHLVDDHLVLESQAHLWARLKEMYSAPGPGGLSALEELRQERRQEFLREAELTDGASDGG